MELSAQILEQSSRARLQIDTKPIKRIFKCLQSNGNKTELLHSLDAMSYIIYKQTLIQKMNYQEQNKSEGELLSKDFEITEADKTILELEQELEIAKENAKQRKAYDLIANQILSVPSRKKTKMLIEMIKVQITEKQDELALLNDNIEKRKGLVQELIDNILVLQKQIKTADETEDGEMGILHC